MKLALKILMIGFGIILAGCQPVPSRVAINPVLNPIAPANMGQGKYVAIQILSQPCGNTNNAPNGYISHLCYSETITPAVHDAIFRGLQDNGFRPIDNNLLPNAPRKLFVKILGINSNENPQFYYANTYVDSMIQVSAFNPYWHYAHRGNWTYTYTYRISRDKSYVPNPSAEQKQANITMALSDNINQIINDRNLLTFLAK